MAEQVNTIANVYQRRELVPILRYGNFAGPGYAGHMGSETVLVDPNINGGKPIKVAELTRTPEGLAQFMSEAAKVPPNGYLDAVTRNHDVEYTVAEVRYMNKVQTQFGGRLPDQLSSEETRSPTFKQLVSERNQEYWQADQRMLHSVTDYQPVDFADAAYKSLMVKGFYVKAGNDTLGGDYGIPKAEVDGFFDTLKAKDPTVLTPNGLFDKLSALGDAGNLAKSDFEQLVTLPLTPQERAFFNTQLTPSSKVVPSDLDAQGNIIPYDQRDFSRSIVVPFQSPDNNNLYMARVKMGNSEVTSWLDKSDRDHPVFTQETRVNGVLVSTEVRRVVDSGDDDKGQLVARTYQVEVRNGQGELQTSYTLEKPAVPDLPLPPDLQAKINAVISGNYSDVVPEIKTNPFSAHAVNGIDQQSNQADQTPATGSSVNSENAGDPQEADNNDANSPQQQIEDAFNSADQSAADIKAKYPGTLVADGSGALSDAIAQDNNSFSNYLNTQGTSLTPAQQETLAAQVNSLGLGGEADLSFYSLPGGGALIANADGDIVGEINHSDAGDLNLRATGIDADGSAVQVSQHISESGQSLSDAQYSQQQLTQLSAGLGLVNNFESLQNWGDLNDLSRLSTLVGTYNNLSNFTSGASGFLGDLGPLAGGLGLLAALDSGDGLGIVSSINVLTDSAVDGAINSALGSSGIPYLSIITSLANFEDNPAQSIGSLVGMAIGGPIGAAIGGLIGGLFGDDDPPPPPEGVVHFSWDANGHIQHTVDYNQSGGGDAASSVAASVQGLLEQVVQAINDKTPDTADDVALNPYLIPKVGYSGSSAWIEVSLSDGTTVREGVRSETIATRLVELLQGNGGLAPAWQVQTVQGHYQQAQGEIAALQAQLDEAENRLPRTQGDEFGWSGVHPITTVQPRYKMVTQGDSEYAVPDGDNAADVAAYNQAQAALSAAQAQLQRELTAGIGGQASAGNEAYSLQGNAVESADFKSQSFGALVVHVGDNPDVQAAHTQLTQALLALDLNGDGQISVGERVNLQAANDDYMRSAA